MKVYMAGTSSLKNHQDLMQECDYFLESFVSIKAWQMPHFKSAKGFLLDSGAFTFMGGKKDLDFRQYATTYANFVREYDIEQFFELDIETIVGWDEYKRINDLIGNITQRQAIPVFHQNRGLQWFQDTCKTVDYIAFGGVAAGSGRTKKIVYDVMPEFIKVAHRNRTKIHGLGFTATSKFDKIRFDSVDSTTWTMSGRLGILCYFDGKVMKQFHSTERGKKMKNAEDLTVHNFQEWIKFQKYAERMRGSNV